jgi:S1-C subfamily serine protease
VPPLPGELHGAVPPGGESHWAPPGGYGQPPAPPPSRGPMSRVLVYVVVAVLAAAVGAGAVFALRGTAGPAPSSSLGAQDIPKPKANPGAGAGSSDVTAAVARKVEPGLVDITSYVHYQQQVFEGTGMVLSANGLVLTNNHVIKGSTRVTAQLVSNGRKYTAQVVGTDNAEDVALLRLEGASGLATVTTGDSSKVKLGDTVVALGNAGGNGGTPTVTSGTITALKRTITASDAGSGTSERLTNMFQTNAPIAEGDSGGALASATGQVIAMNTAANSQNIGGGGTAQGFAIPIDRALLIARQIAAGHGSSTIQIGQPAFIGIAIASDPKSGAPSRSSSPRAQLGQLQRLAQGNFSGGINSSGRCLANESANPVPNTIAPAKSGALIAGVFCGAPATNAGAAAGDVITEVNGHAVTSPASLRVLMRQYHPGSTVSLTWIGLDGHQQTGSLKLAAGPAA